MLINTSAKNPEKITEAISFFLSHHKATNKKITTLAIYCVYIIFMNEAERYKGKQLLFSGSSSKLLGDIEVRKEDGSPFEVVSINHKEPITAYTVLKTYRKIQNTKIDRYYILTTSEPNFEDYDSVKREIEKYEKIHSCQIIVNGVIPSLKYYMRLINNPQDIIEEYTKWLEFEFKRASGIKREHLKIWQEIRQEILNLE